MKNGNGKPAKGKEVKKEVKKPVPPKKK